MLVKSNLTYKLMQLILKQWEETLDTHSIREIKALDTDIHKYNHTSSSVYLNKILRRLDKVIFKTMLKVTQCYKTNWAIFTRVTKTPIST